MNTSIRSTAGSASSSISTETNGDGGIVIPGVVKENGLYDDHNIRSDEAATKFDATDVMSDVFCLQSDTLGREHPIIFTRF